MLTLAAISYRGYNLLTTSSEASRYDRLRAAMVESLNTLAPVKDHWDIVWGPASYSHSLAALDEVVIYVAQNREKPTMFVVAIRGTNPISLSDWISGDLMVNETVPWPYGSLDGSAEISCSTAFNLSVLQHLRKVPFDKSLSAANEEPSPSWLQRLRSFACRWFPDGATRADNPFGSLAELVAAAKTKQAEIEGREAYRTLANECKRMLPEHLDTLTIFDDKGPHSSSAPGVSVVDFFSDTIRKAQQPIDIYVTGHSKGGSLSSTFALWLADTQGTDRVPAEDRWDPERHATVYAYSFAGPTAGNREFASHSNAVIGDRCWRFFNKLDVVPHAWAVSDLEQIPFLYGSTGLEHAALTELCGQAVNSVGHLNYQQIGNPQPLESTLKDSAGFLEQAVHQHLQAYFNALQLSNDMSLATFFKPVL